MTFLPVNFLYTPAQQPNSYGPKIQSAAIPHTHAPLQGAKDKRPRRQQICPTDKHPTQHLLGAAANAKKTGALNSNAPGAYVTGPHFQ